MPYKPKRFCAAPGCGVLLGGAAGGHVSRCPQHAVPAWRPVDRAAPARIRGRKLQQLRKELFDRTPLCVECDKAGRVSIATVRDHIIPLAEGGTDSDSNCRAVCRDCNERKRHDEVRRGIARWR